ncbi:hypothetical protein JTE90_026523 [Oedothorax gibbosus]|uniref:DUF4592 domain-containing protein n=1 Tax=Oedothorax gibbosus TaxID=931172 RepID=A0AAV6VSY3_9ARAC|nr:hypothetical protein JTE90_026523 [Oedothorax gibbosus]
MLSVGKWSCHFFIRKLMAASKQPALPPESIDEIDEVTRETKWKRFHPFRVVRKIFRRRVKRDSDASKKSWSTSELQSVQEDDIGKPEVSSALKIGFSVSHDSIFSPEGSANAISGEPLGISPGSSLSINHTTIKNMFKDELFSTIHHRRSMEDEDDEFHHSPSTTDNHNLDLKEKTPPLYRSSNFTRHDTSRSYKHSFEESNTSSKILQTTFVDTQLINTVDITTLSPSVPLNHKAALHKISVKPKRTHGLPGRRKKQIAAVKEMPEIKEKEERSTNVVEVSKAFTETTATGSKQVSISSHSSEWKVSSISYKEEVNSMQETLVEDKSNPETEVATLITKEIFEGHSKNINEVTKAFCDDDGGLISKRGNQPLIEHSTDDEEHKSKLINSKSFIDSSIDVGLESPSFIKEFSKRLNNSSFEIHASLQSMPASKLSPFVKDAKTNEDTKYSDKKYLAKDDPLALNTNIDHDTNFVFQKNPTEKVSESFKNADYLLKNNVQETYDALSTDNLNIKAPGIEKGTKPCKIPGINIALKPAKESIFNDEQSLTSLCFEEENILSTMSVKESGIYVSHHSSVQSDFNTVTEAHNFAAVEEVLNQASGSKCEPWISSVDILAPRKFDADVTVNSATSTICDNKVKEDKITISVNSKSEKLKKSMISSHEKVEKPILPEDSSSSIVKTVTQQPCSKEKQPLKSLQKQNLQENNPSSVNAKNLNTQKRVSVEIVPFSQRMKERKYQPIAFNNKETPEQHKNPNVAPDKNVMDHKLCNNKEINKNVTTKTTEKGKLSSEKKSNKPEKLQYPVQIRVHKSKPNSDGKDKSIHSMASKKESENFKDKVPSSEVKFSTRSSKDNLGTSEIKTPTQNVKDKISSTEVKFSAQVSKDKVGSTEIKLPSQAIKDKIIYTEAKHSTQSVKVSQSNVFVKEENKIEESLTKREMQHTFPARKNTPLNIDNEKECVPEANLKMNSCTEIENKVESKITDPNGKQPSLSEDPEPELLRVFARRSIKQKHCDKEKPPDHKEKNEENNDISVSSNGTVIQISETPKPHITTKHELKKKSKSFCEKAPRAVSPLKEMNLIPGESLSKLVSESPVETIHPRQRLASVSDVPLPQRTPPPPVKEDLLGLGEQPTWLQLAQQRREMREQRERLLLGGSPNSFMDPSNKPARSSKVWDMVNNFQKLQMT